MGKSTEGKPGVRDFISIALNLLIVVFTVCGICAMIAVRAKGAALTSSGLANLKYFTVLSNVFCGIAAALWLVFRLMGKVFPVFVKIMASAAVGLTFFVVACFLAPMYPDLNMYRGGNLWFHLIVPVTAMLEFAVLKVDGRVPMKHVLLSALPALVYGAGYVINILVNGVGKWPDTNDWYGFLNWGYGVGAVIFLVMGIMNALVAFLLRVINGLVNKLFK